MNYTFEFTDKLQTALGLSGRALEKLVVTLEVGERPKVSFVELLPSTHSVSKSFVLAQEDGVSEFEESLLKALGLHGRSVTKAVLVLEALQIPQLTVVENVLGFGSFYLSEQVAELQVDETSPIINIIKV